MRTLEGKLIIDEFQGEYRWLSNFWTCNVYIDTLIYPSSEAAYQAYKTANEAERLQFTEMNPGQAKKAGKTIKLREDWEEVKIPIMYRILLCKFTQNRDLMQKLANIPYGTKFIEGNNWNDTFWGVSKKTGMGYNILGKLLGEVHQIVQETLRLSSDNYVREYYK